MANVHFTVVFRRAVAALGLALAACATVPEAPSTGPASPAQVPKPTAPPLPRTAEPPPPPVNLEGFPLPYRQGFADGCASATGAERKDSTRFSADGNYRTGWQDGLAQCRRRK
jgi:hypothetical protein